MYEYFHQDDIGILAETHRSALKNSENCSTQVWLTICFVRFIVDGTYYKR